MKRAMPLHVNILTIFTAIITVVVLVVVSYGYVRNSDSAVIAARLLLQTVGATIAERTRNVFDTAFMTAEVYSNFPDVSAKATLHSHPITPAFFEFLKQHPDFTSIYIGFADGDFYLVSSLREREEMKKKLGIPAAAMWYTQTIGHQPNGRRFELKKYLDAGYVTIGSSGVANPDYDPRRRGWFRNSIQTDQALLSDIYMFAFSGEPGITVSRRFDSEIPGVLGVDLSLTSLSSFVRRQLVGNSGDIMIFDAEGNVYACSDQERLLRSAALSDKNAVTVEHLDSPALTALMGQFREHGVDALSGHEMLVGRTAYLAHVERLPKNYGRELFVGVMVPKSTFTGPLARIGRQTLFVSLAILLVFLPLVFFVSKRISKPLISLTSAVEGIKAFRLEAPVAVESNIIEIRELSGAMETMRSTLNAFGSYIPRPLVESMLVNDITPKLGGVRKELTFLISDIKDFTTLCEGLTPEEVTGSITRYLKHMGRAILDSEGTIDKYVGDSIMAFWNAPVRDDRHARNACLAALRCRAELAEYNARCRETGHPEFLTRMGLHTGEAVVGNIGSSDRMEYTAMGASVNLASRLEGLNKYLGTGILVSETTRNASGGEFLFRFAGKVTPKGATAVLRIYELLGAAPGVEGECAPFAVPEGQLEQVREWEACMDVFLSRDFRGAGRAFAAYAASYGPDGLADFYLPLAEAYAENPPDETWRGEQTFDAK